MLIELVPPAVRRQPDPPPIQLRAKSEKMGIEAEVQISYLSEHLYVGVMSVERKASEGKPRWHFCCSPDSMPDVLADDVLLWLEAFIDNAKRFAEEHYGVNPRA